MKAGEKILLYGGILSVVIYSMVSFLFATAIARPIC